MGEPLNVLVLESHHGVADRATLALKAAGHRVHRCHDRSSRGFPCLGLSGGPCPVDGPIDVALAVRHRVSPRPTPSSSGVGCAVRAGIPLVVDGAELLDPFAEMAAAHLSGNGEDVVATCETVAAAALDPLAEEIRQTFEPLLSSRGYPVDSLEVELEPRDDVLVVHLSGTDVPRAIVERLGVRALDPIRQATRRWRMVDVVVGR
jgi:hypothetical protein